MERYNIIRELARGASGIVSLALDRELDRTAALKSIRHGTPSVAARAFSCRPIRARFS